MNKILIHLLILSVLFAALTEEAEALGLFGKAKAGLMLKGAMLAKKAKLAKLALPKLKKVAKLGALKKAALKKAAIKKVALKGALGHKKVVAVPLARPNSHEFGHYVESAHPIAVSGHHYRPGHMVNSYHHAGVPVSHGAIGHEVVSHGAIDHGVISHGGYGHGGIYKKPIIAPIGIKKAGIKKLALKKAGLKKLGLLKKMLG